MKVAGKVAVMPGRHLRSESRNEMGAKAPKSTKNWTKLRRSRANTEIRLTLRRSLNQSNCHSSLSQRASSRTMDCSRQTNRTGKARRNIVQFACHCHRLILSKRRRATRIRRGSGSSRLGVNWKQRLRNVPIDSAAQVSQRPLDRAPHSKMVMVSQIVLVSRVKGSR